MLNFLRVVGADVDEDGAFLIVGEPVISGLDPEEVVISAGCFYLAGGRPEPLAAGLGVAGHGLGVHVIA